MIDMRFQIMQRRDMNVDIIQNIGYVQIILDLDLEQLLFGNLCGFTMKKI